MLVSVLEVTSPFRACRKTRHCERMNDPKSERTRMQERAKVLVTAVVAVLAESELLS